MHAWCRFSKTGDMVFVGHLMDLLNSSRPIWCCLPLPRCPCRFSKTGDMVFVGHLDLMKTFDRACRRAALPISGAALVIGVGWEMGVH